MHDQVSKKPKSAEISLALAILILLFYQAKGYAIEVAKFTEKKLWQCTFSAELNTEVEEASGPGGMAHGSKRRLFQALGATGVKAQNPGGDTDSYRETRHQRIEGRIRLHHVYDGGPDGIQIAGWGNGGAEVDIRNTFEGSEQNKIIHRDKTTTYSGPARFEGEEYEPAFQIWIYPEQGTYSLEYRLSPVPGKQVEHCRMKEEMEGDRKKLESATDGDMPLGSFFSGLTKVSCPTERIGEVQIDGGALAGMVEDVPLPSGVGFSGEGESQFVDTQGVRMRWNCHPE
jgi:hypothetical protein